MESVVSLLYVISTALQLPVVIVLLLLLAWTTLQTGMVVREYVELRRYRREIQTVIDKFKKGEHADAHNAFASLKELRGPGRGLIRAADRGEINETVFAKIVEDVQLRLDARVSYLAIGVRLGPMFGLMGTLIPMGPALTGLASGDINVLTENLVVAFSTTVLGLLIGGVCYILLAANRRSYARDMSNLDFLHDLLLETRGKKNAETHAKAEAAVGDRA